jgi:DNA-binding NtrC family response regulator
MSHTRPLVLVADDQPLIGWALTKVLEPLGFEVAVATTRSETRGQLMANRYASVVVSVRLGTEDMLDVLGEIEQFQPLTGLFALTEPGTSELVEQSVPSARIFEKPFGVTALAEAVRADLSSRSRAEDVPA